MMRRLINARFDPITIQFIGEPNSLSGISYEQLVYMNDEEKDNGNIEAALSGIDKSKNTLMLVSNTDFAVFDFALYLVESFDKKTKYPKPIIVFIQSTLSTAASHNAGGKDITNLTKENGVGIRVLNALFPTTKHSGTVEKIGKSRKMLIFENDEEEELNVHYVYASSVIEAMQDRGNSDQNRLPDNVTVLSNEQLREHFYVIL